MDGFTSELAIAIRTSSWPRNKTKRLLIHSFIHLFREIRTKNAGNLFIHSFIYSSIHSFIHLSISQVDEPDWLMALISTVRLWRLSSEKSSCSSPSCINNRIKERLTYHGGDRHGIERHGNSMMEFQPVIQESHVVSATHYHTQLI